VITNRFAYHRPESLDEAAGLLAEGGADARVLAGGTWVVPNLTRGTSAPRSIVDLRAAGLGLIRRGDDGVSIGPMTTYAELGRSELVAKHARLLCTVAGGITGGQQIRNQGTIGGSACYATPSSDIPGVLVALAARVRIASTRGTREVAAGDFFRDAFRPDLEADELVTELVVPERPPSVRYGYYKLKLCESSWPIATASCVVTVDDGGVCTSARLALGGVAAVPLLVEVEDVLAGTTIGPEELRRVAELAERAVADPWSDVLADGEYRRNVAGVVAKRAVAASVLSVAP
jgi:CO/xanthine dehydrogenase FAD-binding subunit